MQTHVAIFNTERGAVSLPAFPVLRFLLSACGHSFSQQRPTHPSAITMSKVHRRNVGDLEIGAVSTLLVLW